MFDSSLEQALLLHASLARSFNPFNLDEALLHAESVEFNLTTPHLDAWRDWLAHVFQDLQVVDDPRAHATLDAIHGLQQAGATILTTNYDSLLSDVTGLPPVTWEENARRQ